MLCKHFKYFVVKFANSAHLLVELDSRIQTYLMSFVVY